MMVMVPEFRICSCQFISYCEADTMQCKYVRQSACMSFIFHPKTISLFSLVHFKNRLRIIQENLYTGLIMNDFPVPLREETLEVDNYSLCYNDKLNLIVFTLSNHILLYSLETKTMLVVTEATHNKMPLYITQTTTKDTTLYFTATQQKAVYSFNLEHCIKSAGLINFNKFKVGNNSEAEIQRIACTDKVLVGLCSDRVVRLWDLETTNPLKGFAIQFVGKPTCFSFSKNNTYLLIGTNEGHVQAWDGETLGIQNTKIMSEKILKFRIQSLCWFHYAGESNSLRFLVFTQDGSIKLYSFWFEKKDETYIARCTLLSLLYKNRHQILDNFVIQSHNFANFVFFSPGVLLYMVDSHSLIYYPVTLRQPSLSFEQLTPNAKKEVFYSRDNLFMQGLEIKRVKDTIEDKVSLQNNLEYKELKVLRLDARPLSSHFAPLFSKVMVVYYLNSSIRSIVLSRLNLNEKNEDLAAYKEYNGSWVTFIGPKQFYEPFIMIVQDDKQTITVLMESAPNGKDLEAASEQERKYLELGPGEIYTKKITMKIQKLYLTPFRYHYVVLYQSENILRFSNNINYDAELINYDAFMGLTLRMDGNDIILDVVWTHGGEIGAVVCLDKVVFINADLKIMRSVIVNGYIVQGQWVGYTLLVTTKKDVQYFDILSKPQQAYCLESLESKYLIMKVMCDRIVGIEKNFDGNIQIKARYFKIMEPLVGGYLNYQQIAGIIVDEQKIKHIIQCFAPYFNVSEDFIGLLNSRNLSSISKYFLEGNEKMYSKPLRAKTLNNLFRIQRFIPEQIWLKNKKALLDMYLSYEQSKDSSDPYEKEKQKQIANKMRGLIGTMAFDSIKDLSKTEPNKGVSINISFGQQSLNQLYYDFDKENQMIKMQIYPFKAENCGEWLGQFGMYIESKQYFGDDAFVQANSMPGKGLMRGDSLGTEMQEAHEHEEEDQQNSFKNLIVYFRYDDGKGQTVEDLSDYGNNGTIAEQDNWIALDEVPMEIQDKWGKKCPPQFSLTTVTSVSKKLNSRYFHKMTIQIWIKPLQLNFDILKLGKSIEISCQNLSLGVRVDSNLMKFDNTYPIENGLSINSWSHVSIVFDEKQQKIQAYVNSELSLQAKSQAFKIPRVPMGLAIGDENKSVEYTELRLWAKALTAEDIKQNMRTPLELVAEKRKKKIKIKEKKKKESAGTLTTNPFSLE